MNKNIQKQLKNLPLKSGVYFFKDDKKKIIYVGKAVNLKKRVNSYFQRTQDLDLKTRIMVGKISDLDFVITDSEIEALILEAELIKRYKPKYNVRLKDDKSYLYLGITKGEDFPRIFFARKGDLEKVKAEYFGPYTSATFLREAVKFFRRLFPIRTCSKLPKKTCLWYHLGRCAGPCENKITPKEYAKIIQQFRQLLKGKKKQLLKSLEKEMKAVSKKKEFEKAAALRDKIFALKHLEKVWLSTQETWGKIPKRIECFDISNIMGKEATGSMVVFIDGEPDKNEYRRFRIKTVKKISDYEMLAEVLGRRFSHTDWPMPQLVIIDGGTGQLNIARKIILEKTNLNIPIIAIAKGPQRKKDELFFAGKKVKISKKLIQRIRNEAHRFAIKYHHLLRSKKLLER